MKSIRSFAIAAAFVLSALPVRADDVLDAIDQARKAYDAKDYATAKQQLDLASQMVGQKNAENFGELLPAALAGWTAEKVETSAVGTAMFGASSASRAYRNGQGQRIEVQITGDSGILTQMATFINNPIVAGAMGKIVRINGMSGIVNKEGDVHILVANKFLVMVTGNGPADAKFAYAQAVDVGKLSKM